MHYRHRHLHFLTFIFLLMSSCHNAPEPNAAHSDTSATPGSGRAAGQQAVRLITLDPGHFHAALVQKSMYPGVDSNVYVYAPAGQDVTDHLARISAYNTREKDPTRWEEHVYTGPDFLQRMIDGKKGNTVVLAGNNREKTNYILRSLESGFNVLADKPMVIDAHAFDVLRQAFDTAAARRLVLYDIMTERYEITSMLQRELAALPAVYGTQVPGDASHPGITASSVHRWYKYVSGKALIRPAWSFDVSQQGEGIVDVMTHLVDLVQWVGFPGRTLDYARDIRVDRARHWTTGLTLSQFRTVTGLDQFPDFLKKYTGPSSDTVLKIYANGEIDYHLRGVSVRTAVTWTYDAPPGAGDTYSSVMRGTRARLVISQGSAEHYQPALYIEPLQTDSAYEKDLVAGFAGLETKYPGISLEKKGSRWAVLIPDRYKEGHEAHFARVTEKYLGFLKNHDMPSWEIPNMIAKYYTTTRALEMARNKH